MQILHKYTFLFELISSHGVSRLGLILIENFVPKLFFQLSVTFFTPIDKSTNFGEHFEEQKADKANNQIPNIGDVNLSASLMVFQLKY